MPRVADLIDRVGQANNISTINPNQRQVPVTVDNRCKTVFATPFGLYQFIVTPFGLEGAPATFQREHCAG